MRREKWVKGMLVSRVGSKKQGIHITTYQGLSLDVKKYKEGYQECA